MALISSPAFSRRARKSLCVLLAGALLAGPLAPAAQSQTMQDMLGDPRIEQILRDRLPQGEVPAPLSPLDGYTLPEAARGQTQPGTLPGARGSVQQQDLLALQPRKRAASELEEEFSRRARAELRLFGYDAFGQGSAVPSRQVGAVQDSYILGVGDEIVVSLRGQENSTARVRVDRDGRLVLPRLAPLSAAGRSFAELRRDVEQAVAQAQVGTQAFVSLGQVRQLTVLVAGEVGQPGTQTVSALSTVLDALLLAGGIKPSGSLRQIAVTREGRSETIDLYGFLDAGSTAGAPVALAEGARIVVPPIGDTVAVSGRVKRPGIYELKAAEREVGAQTLIDLAGGPVVRGAYRYAILRIGEDGRQRLTQVADLSREAALRDGEILFVQPARDVATGVVVLAGQVATPGLFPVEQAGSLRALLGGREALGTDPYLALGVIVRTDPVSLARRYIPFDVGGVIHGRGNVALKSDDQVLILGREDIRFLSSNAVLRAINPQLTPDLPREPAALQRSLATPAPLGIEQQPLVPLEDEALLLDEQANPAAAAIAPFNPNLPSTVPPSLLRGDRAQRAARALTEPKNNQTTRDRAAREQRELDLRRQTSDQARELAAARTRALAPQSDLEKKDDKPIATETSCPAVLALAQAVQADPDGTLGGGPMAAAAAQLRGGDLACPQLLIDNPDLLPFLVRRSVLLRGGVDAPGLYPVAGPGQVETAARFAGARDPSAIAAAGLGLGAAALDAGVVDVRGPVVSLVGHVRFPGVRALSTARSARQLLADPDLLDEEPYLLFALVERRDPLTRQVTPLAFSPARVSAGAGDIIFNDKDVVRFFSREDVRRILASAPGRLETLQSEQRAAVETTESRDRFGRRRQASVNASSSDEVAAEDTELQRLRRILLDHVIRVEGEVAAPGSYAATPGVTLALVVQAAGGVSTEADLAVVEVTSSQMDPRTRTLTTERRSFDLRNGGAERIALNPGDAVRLRRKQGAVEQGTVLVRGQVGDPGEYSIVRGEKLSSLLRRAGGLTDIAYPYGSVFTRRSAARAERASLERLANELERTVSAVTAASRSADRRLQPEEVAFLRTSAQQLREQPVLGRIVIEADPAVLAVRPDLDTILEPGDEIYIPRRPSTVQVAGEVLNPSTLRFTQGQSVADYIEQTGGYSDTADTSLTFVILPDGTARRVKASFWSSGRTEVPPGSTVVVPRDLRPFDFYQFTLDFSEVFARMATGLATIILLQDD